MFDDSSDLTYCKNWSWKLYATDETNNEWNLSSVSNQGPGIPRRSHHLNYFFQMTFCDLMLFSFFLTKSPTPLFCRIEMRLVIVLGFSRWFFVLLKLCVTCSCSCEPTDRPAGLQCCMGRVLPSTGYALPCTGYTATGARPERSGTTGTDRATGTSTSTVKCSMHPALGR